MAKDDMTRPIGGLGDGWYCATCDGRHSDERHGHMAELLAGVQTADDVSYAPPPCDVEPTD